MAELLDLVHFEVVGLVVLRNVLELYFFKTAFYVLRGELAIVVWVLIVVLIIEFSLEFFICVYGIEIRLRTLVRRIFREIILVELFLMEINLGFC